MIARSVPATFVAVPGTYIVTGANRGLGLAIAHALAAHSGVQLILAVRDPDAARPLVQTLRERAGAASDLRVRVEALDLGSLASVAAFCQRWRGPVSGLVNNAGLQNTGSMRLSADGLEETFAVNYLGALALSWGMRTGLRGGRCLFIGSGTHHPRHVTARLSGFRGARFQSVAASAHPAPDSRAVRQAGRDRYATSKLLCTSAAHALARGAVAEQTQFFCLDPGMMPGTDLARGATAVERFVWKNILPALRWLLPDTTTTARSAASAAWLIAAPQLPYASGAILNYRALPSRWVAAQVWDQERGRELLAQSRALLSELGYEALTDRV